MLKFIEKPLISQDDLAMGWNFIGVMIPCKSAMSQENKHSNWILSMDDI